MITLLLLLITMLYARTIHIKLAKAERELEWTQSLASKAYKDVSALRAIVSELKAEILKDSQKAKIKLVRPRRANEG